MKAEVSHKKFSVEEMSPNQTQKADISDKSGNTTERQAGTAYLFSPAKSSTERLGSSRSQKTMGLGAMSSSGRDGVEGSSIALRSLLPYSYHTSTTQSNCNLASKVQPVPNKEAANLSMSKAAQKLVRHRRKSSERVVTNEGPRKVIRDFNVFEMQ